MATIDSASHWNDGTTGCRNQRAPRIGEIQRHKAVELEHSPTSSVSSSNSSSTNSSTSKSPTATSPSTANPFAPRTSSNNSANKSDPSRDCGQEVISFDVDADVGTNDTKRMADGSFQETRILGKEISESDGVQNVVIDKEAQSKEVGFKVKNVKVGFATVPNVARTKERGIQRTATKGDPLKSLSASKEAKTKTATPTTNKNAHLSNASATASAFHLLTNSSHAFSSSPSPPHPSVPPPPHCHSNRTVYKRSPLLPKTKSLDLAHNSRDEIDPGEVADRSDEDDSNGKDSADRFASVCRQTTVIQRPQNRFVMNAQSQEDISTTNAPAPSAKTFAGKGIFPKMQSADSRSTSPRTPLSPGGSPLGSPRSNRRRTPLKESRRISIEQSGDAVQVNQYKLMEEIGKGAYGLVKMAYNKDDSTLYAMKMLSKSRLIKKAGLIGRGPKKAPSMTPLQRVYKEIAVLKKLNHPNVVKLVEVLDDPTEDCLYLAFELEQQGDVLRIPTDRPLSEERAWSVFRDALQGLEYLHYQRVIHSDIKPGNLLLGDDGHVKIADLGVCTEFLDEDATMDNKSPAGTPAFRAPETLLEGVHSYNGKAADIWSLGATLYALVYGNVPFVGLTVPVVYGKIKHENLKFPNFPAISEDLRDLISRMLIKDPAQRITIPQIKVHKWVTADGKYPLPTEEENCRLVELESEDLNSVCKSVPKLFDTFVLIKAMLKNHSFQNPFSRSPSGRAPQRGGSRLERFVTAGRSKSAPGDYDIDSRHLSSENLLPVVKESVQSSFNDSSEQSIEDPI